MSLLDDLRDHLVASGFPAPVARGPLPDQPSEALALSSYGGQEGRLRDENNLPVAEYPRVQVVARAEYQARAGELAREAYRRLHWRHKTINGRTYPRAKALQPPHYGGEDESGRVYYVFNVELRMNGPL